VTNQQLSQRQVQRCDSQRRQEYVLECLSGVFLLSLGAVVVLGGAMRAGRAGIYHMVWTRPRAFPRLVSAFFQRGCAAAAVQACTTVNGEAVGTPICRAEARAEAAAGAVGAVPLHERKPPTSSQRHMQRRSWGTNRNVHSSSNKSHCNLWWQHMNDASRLPTDST